jgi:hypothetical protein
MVSTSGLACVPSPHADINADTTASSAAPIRAWWVWKRHRGPPLVRFWPRLILSKSLLSRGNGQCFRGQVSWRGGGGHGGRMSFRCPQSRPREFHTEEDSVRENEHLRRHRAGGVPNSQDSTTRVHMERLAPDTPGGVKASASRGGDVWPSRAPVTNRDTMGEAGWNRPACALSLPRRCARRPEGSPGG